VTSREARAGALYSYCLSVTEARSRFGDETGYPSGKVAAVPYRPLFVLLPTKCTHSAGIHATVNPICSDRSTRLCLDPCVWKRTLAHHLQRLCAQASVAERQLSSRLNGGEAVMSRAPRSKSIKVSTHPKTAGAPLFDPGVFLSTAAVGRDISKHSKKEVIFAQGDDADAVFYIKKGKVKVAVISKQGKEAVVALLGPNEFVGEGCLIGQPKRLATASAMTECETMRVAKTEIQRVIHEEPAFSEMFVSHILERNARVEEDLVDQLFNSTEKRLARLLLLLANFGKEGRPEPILAKISQETLAEMIGTTRSRVSHFMNKFRELGFIDYNGHLEVHTSLLGVLLADQPRTVNLPK
jgi:CRP/FNR family cyclic AMP-dependent transcriptional regulator